MTTRGLYAIFVKELGKKEGNRSTIPEWFEYKWDINQTKAVQSFKRRKKGIRIMISKTLLAGYLIWGFFIAVLFCLGPKSQLHNTTLEDLNNVVRRRLIVAVLVPVVLLCTLPMGLSPSYNGEIPDYTNQYELMAESILDGHLYIEYDDIDPRLLAMDNPYDFEARKTEGVSYHWDHAFYNGHYYMYFGVVPVFLLFLPYRILTGTGLTTYHATQAFTVFFICGFFAVFHMLARRFFKEMSLAMYLALAAAFSIMSVWYSVDAPALYCTAISSAVCMEVWSIFFFLRSVFCSVEDKQGIFCAFLGSLFGALAFGCRPTVALANLLVLPLLAEYLRNKKITVCKCSLLYLVPYDYNFTIYFPEKLEKIRKIIMLGRGVGII